MDKLHELKDNECETELSRRIENLLWAHTTDEQGWSWQVFEAPCHCCDKRLIIVCCKQPHWDGPLQKSWYLQDITNPIQFSKNIYSELQK